jgi:hypothetical protein
MREIDLSVAESPRRTFLCYGHTGSGKTRFAATAPRPAFFSDATESGWTTISAMPPGDFFEPGRKPRVYAIEKMVDMALAIQKVGPLVASGEVQTIVIDSLTFYADMYLAGLFRAGGEGNNLQAYGALGNHLRDLRVSIHNAFPQAHVIWLCLPREPDEANPMGGPLIPGKQAAKFPAGCDYVFFHRTSNDPKLGQRFHVHTRPYGSYFARPRDGVDLPSVLTDPTFKQVLDVIGRTPAANPPLVMTRPVAAAPAPAPVVATANGAPAVRARPVIARRS